MSVGEVNLPSFVVTFFRQDTEVLNIILRIAAALLILQVFRFSLRFFEMWIKGALLEKMAEKMRIGLYGHIQDLDYEFHNNADTGDLIQRCTTDVETTTTFFNNKNA